MKRTSKEGKQTTKAISNTRGLGPATLTRQRAGSFHVYLYKIRFPELSAEVLLPTLTETHRHIARRQSEQGGGLVLLDAYQLLGAQRRRGRYAGLLLPDPGLLAGVGLQVVPAEAGQELQRASPRRPQLAPPTQRPIAEDTHS